MQTVYKYLCFGKQTPQSGKTSVWECTNIKSGTVLGLVKWLSSWRQYCYFPTIQAVYSDGCLDDLSHFIKQLKGGEK